MQGLYRAANRLWRLDACRPEGAASSGALRRGLPLTLPHGEVLARFRADLDRLVPPDVRLGIAVSGGPDSIALLLLSAATRRSIVVATVDHGLRPKAASEARGVAGLCARLDVPHAVLRATVGRGSSLQAQARAVRYAALTEWAVASAAPVLLTAHHADDQAETLLMRLARGAGLSGLSGVRASLDLTPGVRVARPLLNWRKVELQAIVDASGHVAATDPTNHDRRHDRTAVRALLAKSPSLDAARLTASAHHLAQAEDALDWMTHRLAAERMTPSGDEIHLDAKDLPEELARRLLLIAIAQLGGPDARGPDVARALATLRAGGTCTLSGLHLSGGAIWTLRPARPRRAT